MAARAECGKFYHLFTLIEDNSHGSGAFLPAGRNSMAGALAIAMFVALVGFGGRYFGWSDPDGHIQLALITSFILGVIGGFKARS